ncbi:hypothetical protein [Pollutibacter soli]|uniref:hypothetical protein n=1 Tax=Pollutibacter soli TaxID=3034157 RepID=UPI0030139983
MAGKILRCQSCIFIRLKIFLSVLGLFAIRFSFSQDTSNVAIRHFPLEELKGFSQTFYYSSGQEDRTRGIAKFMENAGQYFLQQVAFNPRVTLYILAPQDWKTFAAAPLKNVYGFPHNIDRTRLAIAAEDNDFWKSFLPPIDSIPPAIAVQVKKAYGKDDGSYSMMPFFDLLALHEMGHSYTLQAGLKMHRYWMGELFVNIMLHTYIAEKQPGLLPALEVFPAMVVGAGTADYRFNSLQDFERLYSTLGMGAKNYGWYQCKFHSAAKEIYNAGGKDVMVKLWNALKIHQEEMTDQEFAEMLNREVHPSVANVYWKWN